MKEFFYYKLFLDNLYASENPNVIARNKEFVKEFAGKHNVSDLITLSQFKDRYDISDLSHHHFPCEETPDPGQLERIFKIIDGALADNRSVWIHCDRGYDRSGYVLCEYHIKRGCQKGEVLKRFEEATRGRFPVNKNV